jgi:hypothetical protein
MKGKMSKLQINIGSDIITAQPIRLATIPVIMSVSAFKATVILYIHVVKPVHSGHLGENDKMTTTKLPNLIKDYHPRDIYNMDETGLFNITLR